MNEAVCRVRFPDAIGDNRNHDVIGLKFSTVHDVRGAESQRRARGGPFGTSWAYFAFLMVTVIALYHAKWPILLIAAIQTSSVRPVASGQLRTQRPGLLRLA